MRGFGAFGWCSALRGHADILRLAFPAASLLNHVSKCMIVPAGKELYALAWVVEAASPAIARTLAGIEDVDSICIAVPDVPTVPSEALYGLFAQVQCCSPTDPAM